ncbi:MAG TPA: hypothetical protein VLJ83_06715, partial [Gemmatimonadaceae bacterium]|nr:hypothetical protein [Gemmatimonadaceae bacterium]
MAARHGTAARPKRTQARRRDDGASAESTRAPRRSKSGKTIKAMFGRITTAAEAQKPAAISRALAALRP